MRYKQHIVIDGYPSMLQEHIPKNKPQILHIFGVGSLPFPKKGFEKVLNGHIKYEVIVSKPDSIRPRYLLSHRGIRYAIRGKKQRAGVVYTIEGDNELEVLKTTEECLKELRSLKVPHKKVCKWICPTGGI